MVPEPTSAITVLPAVFNFLVKGFQTGYELNAVPTSTSELLETISQVKSDIVLAKTERIDIVKVVGHEELKAYDRAITDVEVALKSLQALVEPVRLDMELRNGHVGAWNRLMWVVKESNNVLATTSRVIIASSRLQNERLLASIRSDLQRSGFGGCGKQDTDAHNHTAPPPYQEATKHEMHKRRESYRRLSTCRSNSQGSNMSSDANSSYSAPTDWSLGSDSVSGGSTESCSWAKRPTFRQDFGYYAEDSVPFMKVESTLQPPSVDYSIPYSSTRPQRRISSPSTQPNQLGLIAELDATPVGQANSSSLQRTVSSPIGRQASPSPEPFGVVPQSFSGESLYPQPPVCDQRNRYSFPSVDLNRPTSYASLGSELKEPPKHTRESTETDTIDLFESHYPRLSPYSIMNTHRSYAGHRKPVQVRFEQSPPPADERIEPFMTSLPPNIPQVPEPQSEHNDVKVLSRTRSRRPLRNHNSISEPATRSVSDETPGAVSLKILRAVQKPVPRIRSRSEWQVEQLEARFKSVD